VPRPLIARRVTTREHARGCDRHNDQKTDSSAHGFIIVWAMTILLWTFAIVLVAAGLAGLVLPALPGAPLLFARLLAAAWAEDFAYVGTGTLVALGVMALLAFLADFVAGSYGARRHGASPRAGIGAALGAVVGVFFGIPGIVLGHFIC